MKFRATRLAISLRTVLFGLMLTHPVNAVPASPLNVTELYRQSDIVVVGRVQSISVQENTFIDWYGARVAGRQMRAELLPDKLIKGTRLSKYIAFQFFQPDSFLAFQQISQGQYGMFFLKRSASNVISVTSLPYPYVIAQPGSIGRAKVGLSRIAQELSLVLNSATTTIPEKMSSVLALETVEHQDANLILKDALQKFKGQMQIKIASVLLKQGDISALEYAVNLLLASPSMVDQNSLVELASSIEVSVYHAGSIQQLKKLLSSKDARVRRAGAQAIRSTKAQSAIDLLSSLLFDTNPETRYIAVIGLAEITGQYKWGPAQDKFLENEMKYLEYWRKWAQSRVKTG